MAIFSTNYKTFNGFIKWRHKERLSQESSNQAFWWVSIKRNNLIKFLGTVTSCQTPHRNLYLKVSTNCFQKKSLLHHSDSWGIREWSQSNFCKQWPHIKHPVKKIHRKISKKCFHKVYVFSNLVIPWEVEAIRFLSKALHKSFHNKVYFQAPFLQGE